MIRIIIVFITIVLVSSYIHINQNYKRGFAIYVKDNNKDRYSTKKYQEYPEYYIPKWVYKEVFSNNKPRKFKEKDYINIIRKLDLK
tara:strand:+ start:2471 stop:2728 length:258 start_codon:yes stop_codon:yes gene_type:complete